MTKILGLSGRMQSGKNTTSNWLHGFLMKEKGLTPEFQINDKGKLLIHASDSEENGLGILDLDQKNALYAQWASQRLWPMIRQYSFADALKGICMNLFGLTYAQCFGSNEDKDSVTQLKWDDFNFAIPPKTKGVMKREGKLEEFMTAREVLQYFGTNVCRRIYNDCWVDACLAQITKENSDFAIITDCRFANEVEGVQKAGGKVIRLTRDPLQSSHESEVALDKYDNFDVVLDNKNMNIEEQNQNVESILKEWGWL